MGLVLNITYDASVSSAPADFVPAVRAVVQYFENAITTPVTVNIDVGYGEMLGQPLGSGALGESETYIDSFSYGDLTNALVSKATSAADASAVASLPAADPTGGTYWVPTAEAKALGLAGASGSLDGYVSFGSRYAFAYDDSNGVPAGAYDFFGVAAHEISEVLGRQMFDGESIGGSGNGYTPLDLFHFSAPGVRSFIGTQPGYFSADNGTTNLNSFNTNPGGDFGDWAASAGNDAFLAFSYSGVVNAISLADLTELDVLGYSMANAAPPQPALTAYISVANTSVVAGSTLTVNLYDINEGAAAAGASHTALYLSADSTIDSADTLLATADVSVLTAHASAGFYDHQTLSVTVPGNLLPGTYYLGAIADYTNQVSGSSPGKTDNVIKLTVAPQLVANLTAYVGLSTSTVAGGGSLTLDLYDVNLGLSGVGASTTGIYLSPDANIDTGDTLLTTHAVGALTPYAARGSYDHQSVTVSLPANLSPGTYYVGAIADYANQIGGSSPNKTYDVVQISVLPGPVEVTASNVPASHGQSFAASSLFALNDPSGTPVTAYEVGEASGNGYWVVNGAAQPINHVIDLTPAQLAETSYQSGPNRDLLAVRASNGVQWSQWAVFTVTPPADSGPVVIVTDLPAAHGQSFAASSLFAYSDPFSDPAVAYEFVDATGNGHWLVNGTPEGANQGIYVTAAQIGQAAYQSGSGADLLAVRASDGAQWSAWAPFHVNAPVDHPTVSVSDIVTVPGQVFHASALFTAQSPFGDAFTRYEFADAGASGHWLLNSAVQTSPGLTDISAAQLAQVSYQAGSGADLLGVRAYDGTAWSDWAVFKVTGGPPKIAAHGTLELTGAYSGPVAFSDPTGTLRLDDSRSFAGTVAGMSGNDAIDLADINPASVQPPAYSGTSSGGTLSVTDGTHTARVAILGYYLASTFVAVGDGQGGTSVVEQPQASTNNTALSLPHA